jgi:hypothetical protein
VLERKVEEHPLVVGQADVEAAGNCRVGHGARLGIPRIGRRRAAIEVAWQLIEQDDQREGTMRATSSRERISASMPLQTKALTR